jgi:hypothetical protein
MSKFEDTRIVTFKEDYSAGEPPQLFYKKGSTHAIHWKVVKKLEDKGAKMKVEEFDHKAYIKREKEKLLKKDKGSVSVERR